MNKTIFGLNENVAAALTNVTVGIFGVVALIGERENKFVRFYAMQAVIVFFGLAIISGVVGAIGGVFGSIPVVGWLVSTPFGIVNFMLGLITALAWAYLSFSAYMGKMVKVPLIGDAVQRQLEK